MRIYFGVCGIGLGHAGRCIPIARKLLESGDKVLFSTYRDASQYIKQEGLPLIEAPSIGLAVKPDGEIDFRKTTVNPGPFSIFLFLNQLKAEIQYMKSFKPHVVISDSRVSSIIASRLLGIPEITILNLYRVTIPREKRFLNLAKIADAGILTIIGKIWVLGKSVLIPDFPPPYTLSSQNLLIPEARKKKIKFIGPILPIQPDILPKKETIREKLGLDNDRPLVFSSVSGPIEEKLYFAQTLKQILCQFPKHYQIVLSLGNPNNCMEPIKHDNVWIYNWIPNRFEFLKACDLVISRPGLGTLTQSISYGKPLILIPTPSHTEQLNNAKRAAEIGVARIIQQKEMSYNKLVSNIEKLIHKANYQKTSEKIKKEVSKSDAIKTSVEMITDFRN